MEENKGFEIEAEKISKGCDYEIIRDIESQWIEQANKMRLQIKSLEENESMTLRKMRLWRLAGDIKLNEAREKMKDASESKRVIGGKNG